MVTQRSQFGHTLCQQKQSNIKDLILKGKMVAMGGLEPPTPAL